ncbi:ArsR/SmtB family transcription factor [Sinorhizobium fredii]|uniref:ArsR/SmtB family transcription factor n=1 Tax=Rhizobium fredii TaxID=380 RepID=UPI0035114600
MSRKNLPVDELQDKAAEAAEFMRLFSTPSRLMLLCHIAQQEQSVSDIQSDLGLKQPALSQQLAELRQAGLVKTRRESRTIYYSIADHRVEAVMDLLFGLFCAAERPPETAHNGQSRPALASSCARQPDIGEAAQFARLDSEDLSGNFPANP